MGFWKLFRFLMILIVSPKKGWKKMGKFSIPNNIILSNLYYPCLAMLSASVFVPYISGYGYSDKNLSEMVMMSLIEFVKYFISFFVVSHIVAGIYPKETKSDDDVNKIGNFVAFNLAVLIVINIFKNLTPDFPLFDFCPLFIIYVVVSGMTYLSVDEDSRNKFIALSSILLLAIPIGIKFVFELMLPNV